MFVCLFVCGVLYLISWVEVSSCPGSLGVIALTPILFCALGGTEGFDLFIRWVCLPVPTPPGFLYRESNSLKTQGLPLGAKLPTFCLHGTENLCPIVPLAPFPFSSRGYMFKLHYNITGNSLSHPYPAMI